MEIRCSKCLVVKCSQDFYPNQKKKNGFDSNLKTCILKRKGKKYKQTRTICTKTKRLRLQRRVNVLDVNSCTFSHEFINSDVEYQKDVMTLIIGELICQWKIDQK